MTAKIKRKKKRYTKEQRLTAEQNGINSATFRSRLDGGWPMEKAMTHPVGKQGVKAPQPVEEVIEEPVTQEKKVVIKDRRAPWYLYSFYGMFGKW